MSPEKGSLKSTGSAVLEQMVSGTHSSCLPWQEVEGRRLSCFLEKGILGDMGFVSL